MSQEYFASMEASKLAHEVEIRMKAWASFIEGTGLKNKWEQSYRLFYGRHFEGGSYDTKSVVDMGEQGELKGVTVNHYRNFVNHVLTLATNGKPAWQCRALNSDLKSLNQTKLGNQILDAYMLGQRLLSQYKKAAQNALIFGKGYVCTEWEKTAGAAYSMESYEDEDGETRERVVYEGDVRARNLSPFDYCTDHTLDNWVDREWETVRTFKNKYNLAARFSDQAAQILGVSNKDDENKYKYWAFVNTNESDLIPVISFYHKRTDALPNGRYIMFLNPDVVLYDGPIPYEDLPVDRIVPGEIIGTIEGYSDLWDLMPLQEVFNVLISSIFTNQQAFGVQQILIPRTANISVEQLSKGLAGIKFDPQGGKPEACLLYTSPSPRDA